MYYAQAVHECVLLVQVHWIMHVVPLRETVPETHINVHVLITYTNNRIYNEVPLWI